ncbi:MAG: HAD family hydrolase [Akkermansia sp.]|nr:HAD family hydrolase [Akkermansia sp.]MCD8070793.1 HAD family hydrolase [Akkermansiaceae bacterium]
MKHIVFDLDGTLVDSLAGIAEGLNRALAALGYPSHSAEEVRRMVGRGARVLCSMALGIPPEEGELPGNRIVDELQSAFQQEYIHTWKTGTRPYPGISSLLERLADGGAKLAVLSNKPHPVTVPLVRELFPSIPFDPVYGFSGRFPRKPDPASLLHIAAGWGVNPGQVCLVGDSLHDARTAYNAGAQLLLVGWGYGQPASFSEQALCPCETVEKLGLLLED